MTGRHIVNPLAAVLAKAKTALPAVTGEVEAHEARRTSGAGVMIVADVSASMADTAGVCRRIDVLRQALDALRTDCPAASLIAFSSVATEIGPTGALPEPGGSTALHKALDAALAKRPARIVVISDGEPDDAARCRSVVAPYAGTIDTIYCGDDDNVAAIQFMRDLARRGRGDAIRRDLASGPSALTHDLRRLALPRPSR